MLSLGRSNLYAQTIPSIRLENGLGYLWRLKDGQHEAGERHDGVAKDSRHHRNPLGCRVGDRDVDDAEERHCRHKDDAICDTKKIMTNYQCDG